MSETPASGTPTSETPMSESYDAIIIGAGVIGAAIGFELAKVGWRTLNVDKLPEAGFGPTSASCAIIRVHYSTLDGTALAYEGYHYWRDWAAYLDCEDESGLARFVDCGCLVMQTDQNGRLAKHTALADQLGIPYERWSAADVMARLPGTTLASFAPAKRIDDPAFGTSNGGNLEGGIFFPTAGYVTDPKLSAHNLQRAAEAKGGHFRFGRAVVEIVKAEGRIAGVRLDDGTTIAAPVVVNVAGPHSAQVNAMAGADGDMTITTKALRQEVVHVPSPPGLDFDSLGFVMSDSDISCYSRPEHGNHILVGSEDPECDPREFVDPDDYEGAFTDQWDHQAQRFAQRLPSLGIPNRRRGVVSLYDVSDDWIPIYDKSAVPGFYMAIGTSGNQFKNAPVAGKMMAELIRYCEAGRDHDTQPMAFRLTHVGRGVDVGFYSRKRPINPESSFSVLG